VPEACRELKNRINKSIKSGASSWFSARNIARCRGNKTLNLAEFVQNSNEACLAMSKTVTPCEIILSMQKKLPSYLSPIFPCQLSLRTIN
jgi:hypothetical protein